MIRLILLIDFTETYATELLRGILDYSQSHRPWVICRIPPSYHAEHGIERVPQWARQRKAGAITEQFNSNDDISVLTEYGIIVLAQDFIQRFQNIPNITGDYIGQGNLAAEFFIKKGFRDFVFYGYASAVWSQERCKGFSDTIRPFGHHLPSIYIKQSLEYLWCYNLEPLVEWLSKLPSSTAIPACDDARASMILEVCRLLGIRVPFEIAILGVDSDEITCTLTHPLLSSISPDVRRAGYNSAQYIDHILNHNYKRVDNIMVDYMGVVEKRSTGIFMTSNKHILAVLSFIHQFYADNLSVDRLLKLVPMSRRLLEKTFKAETGTSIYQYILDLRFEHMRHKLVSTDTPIAEPALSAGLSDAKSVARMFKKRIGITSLEYRDKHRCEHT